MRLSRLFTAVLVAAILTGCTSSEDGSGTGGDPVPVPGASATVTPAPIRPATASGPTAAAARAFTRHYFDLLNHALRTGDTVAMKGASAPACVSCTQVMAFVEEIYAEGGHFVTAGWRIRRMRLSGRSPAGEPTFHLTVFQPQERLVEASGATPSTSKPALKHLSVYLEEARNGWRMRDFEFTARRR